MILDRDTLRRLRYELMGFERLEELEEFLEACISDMTALVDRAEEALRVDDPHALRIATHTLKSSASLLGAVVLKQRALQIEQGAGAATTALVGELRPHFDDFRGELTRLLEVWRRAEGHDGGE